MIITYGVSDLGTRNKVLVCLHAYLATDHVHESLPSGLQKDSAIMCVTYLSHWTCCDVNAGHTGLLNVGAFVNSLHISVYEDPKQCNWSLEWV